LFDEVEMSEKKRPAVVKILVLIVVIASIIPILAGVMMLTGGAYEGYFMQELLGQILPTYYVLVGVIGLVMAWGLWVGRGWAWVIALIIFIIGIIMDLVTLPTGIVGVVIDGIVVYLLMRPDTRRFCGK
jgi:ABC-type multidrug transport system permease subunit